MRTARLLTVRPLGMHTSSGGAYFWGCIPLVGVHTSAAQMDAPPLDRMTDACENITFPLLCVRAVIILKRPNHKILTNRLLFVTNFI